MDQSRTSVMHVKHCKHGRNHYLSGALVIPRKNNGQACILSGRTKNQARFKNNTFIFILKHFQK